MNYKLVKSNEAPRGTCPAVVGRRRRKPRGIFAEPCDLSAIASLATAEAKNAILSCHSSFGATEDPPCGLPQGFLAKKGKFGALLGLPAMLRTRPQSVSRRIATAGWAAVRRLSRALRSSLPARHSSLSDGGSVAGSVVALLMLLAFIPRGAFAQTDWLTYRFDITTNYPGSIPFNAEQLRIQTNARWGYYGPPLYIWPPPLTYTNAQSVELSDNSYDVYFLTMTNYYVPIPTNVVIGPAQSYTNWYIPYSNTLSVAIAGTNYMTSNVVWSFSASPAELLNSTAYKTSYTNNCNLTPVPTGQYTVMFPDVAGYTTASAQTNITWDSPVTNNITGTYARVYGTIFVTVSPTNGSWLFTPPSDFASFSNSSSALSGTNSATLTNMPVGAYTIHYNDIGSPYVAPANETKTSTTSSTNLSFSGTYTTSTQSWLTVYFNPLEVRDTAQWKPNVAGSSWSYHLESALLNNGSDYLIYYSAVKDYYLPSTYTVSNLFGDTTITNTYIPYTNSLSVVITGLVGGASATWSIVIPPSPSEFTNSTAYQPIYTNSQLVPSKFLSSIPTGSYTIVFNSVSGYIPPDNIITNITGALTPTVTGTYTRSLGNLEIIMTPTAAATNAPWAIISPSPVFTNGTGNTTISNIPIGAYTVRFDDLTGFTPPPNQSGTLTTNENLKIYGNYSNWPALTIVIYDWNYPTDPVKAPNKYDLLGVGTGTYTIISDIAGLFTNGNWSFKPGTEVTLTAIPTNLVPLPDTNSYNSYFYAWYEIIGTTIKTRSLLSSSESDPSIEVTTTAADRLIYLMFSREYYTFDNVPDLDGDGLPNKWERDNNLDPEDRSPAGTNGAAGNPDGDWIPSISRIPPTWVSNGADGVSYYNSDAGYPLSGYNLYDPDATINMGYASTNIDFNNWLECRGLDGYYLNNGPSGWIASDDPLTNPGLFDTLYPLKTKINGTSDGWRYYFWYWRSKNASDVGITNSANLVDWAWFPTETGTKNTDTDGDGIKDNNPDDPAHSEYHAGTDPTHCDTDSDGMDDYWELYNILPSASSNALNNANGSGNPDGDYMARVTNTVLTYGMVGTVLGTNVCYIGVSNNPSAVWNDIITTNAIFDLYRDTILKASVALTNHVVGTPYAFTNYYGTNASLTSYKDGYPVWVDVDNSGTYSAGDYALVNPRLKHDGVYCMAPAVADQFPGVCMFDPRTAWTNSISGPNGAPISAPNTEAYTTYQEYFGRDYLGRISWDAGGQWRVINAADATNPQNQDSEPPIVDGIPHGDGMPDGWELYVGLDPNSNDAVGDPDADDLNNLGEWANATHSLGSCIATWPNKPWPTDPGVIIAPSPNDPHPRDTDWDGLGDDLERANGANPTAYDTDGDGLPDGWEIYAGANVTNSDATLDYDGDGLLNYQEYWTGTVPEWQYCDGSWAGVAGAGVCFMTRRIMPWDLVVPPASTTEASKRWFIPPDFLTDGSFMFYNGISTNVDWLRANYPATNVIDGKNYKSYYAEYHTTKANLADSDGDGMDDYWEVYHGLNPNKGLLDLMMPSTDNPYDRRSVNVAVDDVDADPGTPGFQVGTRTAGAFNSINNMAVYVRSQASRWTAITNIIGPFNFGLQQMDPDGDGLPNLWEYSYSPDRTFYHTDPSPIWRTDSKDAASFANLNYGWDYMITAGLAPDSPYGWNDGWPYMFRFEEKEGFDTDNDGVGDYAEINSAAGELGNNPLDERNPIRNRALYVNGTNDFVRTPNAWTVLSESFLTKFCVEAWIKPDNPARAGDQVILEKAGLYRNPYDTAATIVGANFRLGITNGLPYVLYNGGGALRGTYQATAQIYRLTNGVWAHIAGVYDGATLTLYVNGEFSMSLPTTELPATGVNSPPPGGSNVWYNLTAHSIMVGARDLTCGWSVPTYDALGNSIPLTPASYFGGCIDEVRIWNGARSQAEVIANKNRRIPRSEMTNSPLVHYYSFDDVPDPLHRNSAGALDEPAAPFGLTNLNATMSYHPPMAWWAAHPQRSTVYSGWIGAYNYLVSAADHVAHMSISPPQDDPYHFSTNYTGTNGTTVPDNYNNFSNPYESPAAFGLSLIKDMVMFMGARGVATNSWLDGLDPDNPDSTDTDGDGLPDWWEQIYGLDPNDATGDNGAWGDPDHDGLNNRAEYLAGTDPRNSDTFGTGIGDYDSPRGVYSRTYGEMFTDGDGMPDVWETQNGLDPQKYDANLDLDGDGWSNYAEYQAGTNPNNKYDYPQPLVFGVANYYGNRTGMLRFYAYEINTMDGVPQITKVGTDSLVAEVVGQANGTFIFTGKLPIAPIDVTTVVSISAPVSTNNMFVTFTFTGPETFTYSGAGTDYAATLNYVNGRFTIRWASVEVPLSGANVTVEYNYVNRNAAAFSLTGFKEGDFYLLALMDANGNGSFDAGEPMGIMDNQPAYLSYSSISGIRALITDTRPGFGRFAWTASTLTNAYPVVINKLSESGAPTIIQRSMGYPRNYFHEWDFQLAGIEGLMAGTYQWWMGSQNGTFNVNWPVGLAKPVLVYPRGDVLFNALNQFAWTMDLNCPRAHFQVARGAADGALVTDKYIRAPWMDEQSIFRGWLDDYASDWGNGVYYWRVAGWTPQGESAWSDWQTFNVNLSAANSRWVSGDIYYYGKAPATKIIVDAFDNRGFGGRPVARMTLTPPASTGWVKCSYTLRGLEQGAYYVRAFLDVTPAGGTEPNSKPDAWESVGFYRDAYNFYQAGLVNLSDAQFMDKAKIIIRDRDTDNDKLPDAWEMAYFGNLDQTGDMDYDGDGETNLDEYIKDGVNQNPANWDTDGDGLADGFEPRYNGAAFGFARSAKAVSATLNPATWDTDGDGYSDGAELLRYRTDPLDPTSYPRYRPLCTDAWPSPGDYDGDGRSDVGIYDFNAGVWSFITMAGQSAALPFGFKGAQPMVGDWTGDGCSEFAFYDKGLWSLYTLSGQSATLQLGDASMLPAPADYTGDGRVDLAVFDTDSGIWHIYDVWSGALFSVPFGASGMIPVPGDYNGDGAADLGLYEPATGNWLLGCYHKYYRTWTTFGGTLGGPTWIPVPGDYDGDGRNDACLFEGATGRWMLFTLAGQFLQGTFGWKGCVPVPGDYDGDGRTDLCLYDTNTGMWYIICMSGAYYEGRFGWPGALPILKGR